MNLNNLSLREKVYRTIIIRDFQMGNNGTMEEFFEKYPVGGFYYSKGPVEGLIENDRRCELFHISFLEFCCENSI